MLQSNYNTEKSFRIPQNKFRMSKKDAATVIQKWVKRYILRKSFLMYKQVLSYENNSVEAIASIASYHFYTD